MKYVFRSMRNAILMCLFSEWLSTTNRFYFKHTRMGNTEVMSMYIVFYFHYLGAGNWFSVKRNRKLSKTKWYRLFKVQIMSSLFYRLFVIQMTIWFYAFSWKFLSTTRTPRLRYVNYLFICNSNYSTNHYVQRINSV